MTDKLIIFAVAAVVLLITNLTCFLLMKKDKERAKKDQWRVKESTLFISCACFGGLGGVLGMKLLRHKTKHWYFKVFFPVLLAVQVILLVIGAILLLKAG